LQPGPLLFTREPQLVWGLIASLYIGNAMLLLLNLPLVGLWVRLLTIPRRYLYAGILVLSSVGAYSVNRSVFDVAILYAIGVAGYVMRRTGAPLAPAIIGLILGPMAEQQFRRALASADGSATIFVTRPIAATLLAVAALIVLASPLRGAMRAWSARRARVAPR
jgi:putative tricarboxylic transport membrane protein